MKNNSNKEEEKLREALKGASNPFSIPSGYFEELPGKIAGRISALPDFDKSSVANPFEVPENYFENLPSSIANKLRTQNPKPFSWLNNLLRPRIAIPVAFATIIILIGLFFYKQRLENIQQPVEFTADDLRNSNYLESIDEGMLVEILDREKDDNTIDSYEQYLIDNNIEISQIESAL